jgi:hypothetical protein
MARSPQPKAERLPPGAGTPVSVRVVPDEYSAMGMLSPRDTHR